MQKRAHISLVYCVEGVYNKHAICFEQVKKEWGQVNEKFFELKRDIYIGIVEKAQETSSDSDMHNTV